jgi:hypothetical protein
MRQISDQPCQPISASTVCAPKEGKAEQRHDLSHAQHVLTERGGVSFMTLLWKSPRPLVCVASNVIVDNKDSVV